MTKDDVLRAATVAGVRRFEQVNGLPAGDLREDYRDGVTMFIATTPDGRDYGLGYRSVRS